MNRKKMRQQARSYARQYGILIKTPAQIEGIRRACQLAAQILDAVCRRAVAGTTPAELDAYAYQLHSDAGAIPAPLGYGTPPYPNSICTSRNEVICHGIPDQVPLQEGDIVNIDVSCALHGHFGDCSRMVTIGAIDREKQLVTEVSYHCLQQAIAIIAPGVPLCRIGQVIEQHALRHGCSVVYQFTGHGIGLRFHEPPHIYHHSNRLQIPLLAGMTFTIEPMINRGRPEAIIDPSNQWTARTCDGRPSAQWEHTLLVTEEGHQVLTALE